MSPTDLPSWSASTISTSDGGTSCVIVPEAARRWYSGYCIVADHHRHEINAAMTWAATVPVIAPRMKPTMMTE